MLVVNRRFLLLGAVALFVIVAVAFLRYFVAGAQFDEAIGQSLWWSLVATLDPVKFAEEETVATRLVGVLSSICGLVVVASLIGIVNNSIEERLEQLRKGRSAVFADGHTVVLNWDVERVMSVLQNLDAVASMQKTRRTVVVLSQEDKQSVEDVVYREHGPQNGSSHLDVIVRTGETGDVLALENAGCGYAKTVIVINPELNRSADISSIVIDMPVIRALLALKRVQRRRPLDCIVAELSSRNRESFLRHIGGERVECVVMKEVLSRIMVQSARTPHLASIYEDLLAPVGRGVDFHFHSFPQLSGMRFDQVQSRLYGAVAAGFERVLENGEKQVLMNPPRDSVLQATDNLLVLCEKHDAFYVGPPRQVTPCQIIGEAKKRRLPPEYILLLGYSSKVSFVLSEFDAYVSPGSIIYMLTGQSKESMELPKLENAQLVFLDGDPTDEESLRQVTQLEHTLSCVLVLAREDASSQKEADAKTTISVILLSMVHKGREQPRVICEILDASSKELLKENFGVEFVLSTEVTSRLIAQVAEDRSVAAVYEDCFDPDGSEIYVKTPHFYVPLNQPVSWLSLQAVGASLNEVIIGYMDQHGKAVLNPRQDSIITFTDAHRLVVLSEDDSDYTLA